MRNPLRTRRSTGKRHPQLEKALGDYELPTVPAVITEALARIMDPECNLHDVAQIIERDPGLAAKLLSMSNSAAFAPRTPVLAVTQAVVMLGRNKVESLLISLAANRASKAAAPPGFDLTEFWVRSAWRATTADLLSAAVDHRRRAENLTAALLEDVAVPVILRCHPEYQKVLDRWEHGYGSLDVLTEARFGWSHRTVAGWMFELWEFPEELITAVTETGDPATDEVAYPVVRVVSPLGAPGVSDHNVGAVADKIHDVFGLENDRAVAMITEARTAAGGLANALT